MSKGLYPWDIKAGFKEVNGEWKHPAHVVKDWKIDKNHTQLGECQYRVWYNGDVVYTSHFLDRAKTWASDKISQSLINARFATRELTKCT
jgi:hypothetical protein